VRTCWLRASETLLTEAVFERAPEETAGSRLRKYPFKRFDTAIKLYALPSMRQL
jgi:hypothetical protein